MTNSVPRGLVAVTSLLIIGSLFSGCVSNRLYNPSREQYLVSVSPPSEDTVGVDLAIIEFDEFGMLWTPEQLEAAVSLISERNAASDRGVIVVTYTHGWMNNANPGREENDLT
ncbi:MAG: hypothetical protein AAFQ71_14610 [Planctomycetota bacterium]